MKRFTLKFLTIVVLFSLLLSACGAGTPATTNDDQNSSSIPTLSVAAGDNGEESACSIPHIVEYGDNAFFGCSVSDAPLGFIAGSQAQSQDGLATIWFKPGVTEEDFAAALAGGAVLTLSDGPLPVGDIIAIFLIAGTYYALMTGVQAGAFQSLPSITLPELSLSSAEAVNPGLVLESEVVTTWPEVGWDWRIPEWQWESGKHAAMRRHWPMLFVMLMYLEVTSMPDAAYFGPINGRFVLTKNVTDWGLVVLVFNTSGFVSLDTGPVPNISGLVTIYADSRYRLDKVRYSNCASWQIYPAVGYNPVFDPPPTGAGRCFDNNNTSFSWQ